MTRSVMTNGTYLVGEEFRPVTGGLAIVGGRIADIGNTSTHRSAMTSLT